MDSSTPSIHLIRCFLASPLTRLKEDEGGVPSTVAEAHRKQLEDMDDVVRKEQQVRVGHANPCPSPLVRVLSAGGKRAKLKTSVPSF